MLINLHIYFIRKGKIAINSTILCCKMKIFISIINAGFISYQLNKIFNYSNNLNTINFQTTFIYLFDDDNMKYEFINNIYINEKLNIK